MVVPTFGSILSRISHGLVAAADVVVTSSRLSGGFPRDVTTMISHGCTCCSVRLKLDLYRPDRVAGQSIISSPVTVIGYL